VSTAKRKRKKGEPEITKICNCGSQGGKLAPKKRRSAMGANGKKKKSGGTLEKLLQHRATKHGVS